MIPIKINLLGINSSIYISSPLIDKGTQSDTEMLTVNWIVFEKE